MNANSLRTPDAAPQDGRPIQDEWGLYDPAQAGMPAVMRVPDDRPTLVATTGGTVAQDALRRPQCPFCSEPLAIGARHCSLCGREVSAGQPEPVTTAGVQLSAKGQGGAIYTLESSVRCPECVQEIRTIRVIRVQRTQVSFTSTLPRKGYIIVCPKCNGVLSAELSGLI